MVEAFRLNLAGFLLQKKLKSTILPIDLNIRTVQSSIREVKISRCASGLV